MATFKNRFKRRGWWKRIYKPADADLKEAFADGAACAQNGSAWFKDGRLHGPGADRYYFQQQTNAARVIDDIEEDTAPLMQELSPLFARYQGFLEQYLDAERAFAEAEMRHGSASGAREKNQARFDRDGAERKRDALFANLEELRAQAEEDGLSELRNIQAKRLGEAYEHQAHMNHLMSYFLRGVASVCGTEAAVESAEQDRRWTQGVIDRYIAQLEGEAADGRWNMDFSRHLRRIHAEDAADRAAKTA